MLNELLCQLCCGLSREKEINCPPDCPYLQPNKDYQEKRSLIRNSPDLQSLEENIFQDEKLAWLAYNIERAIFYFSKNNQDLNDKDVQQALKDTEEELEKIDTLIIPDQQKKPIHPLGQEILRAIEQCRYEKQIILPDSYQTYKKEDKLKVIKYILATVKSSGGGNSYLRQTEKRIAGAEKILQNQKLSSLP